MAESTYDMVVVGAGWFGLAAARAYIETHAHERIAVLESAESCGGTWSEARLYPGLKSNNMVGSYEYPDFPMSEDVYGVKEGGHIPGAVLHRYLTDFARKHGVLERIQFHTKVDSVEALRSPESECSGDITGWRLTVTTTVPDSTQRQVTTSKLILATGLTSTPNFPRYAGAESFDRPLFHAKDFCRRASEFKAAEKAVVVGGAKSAYDVAYALVQGGATVDLVIRPNGHGPVWISPRFVTPLKRRLDTLLNTRCLTWFSPCPWGAEGGHAGITGFLHGTRIGRLLVNCFWKVLEGDVLGAIRYDSHPELAKLKPWNSAFWIGSGLSILNYDTPLFDLVKDGRIRVHIDNIDHLEPGKVALSSGEVLEADGMVCSTGWRKESSIVFTGLDDAGLGLSQAPVESERLKLNAQADSDVLTMFPRLQDQPQLRFQPKEADPLRYYRFIVPSTMLKSRNLAFAGMVSTVSTAVCATVQAAWIAAFLDGKLDRIAETPEEVTQEIMLHTQWGKWRYPCGGLSFTNKGLGLWRKQLPVPSLQIMEIFVNPVACHSLWVETL
ncbi:putative flavin-binding monooxygenase-like protein [Diaporthe ampelina]|uniref:Putative flavin-binding monooxygenase-like protein n=1 Tax=Diaporthe ampelina TaxID=1214573 RepID=A0A0G2FUP6_9PEZI|nr:putative flavin-binding monooxygenase-like protein [Diaporthe ampelina]